MLLEKMRTGVALLSILYLSSGLCAPSARAAEHGGRHLYRISRPNGIVMIVELYGYEIDDAKRFQQEAHAEALDDWTYGAREWAALIQNETYPVPKPVEPDVKFLEDLTGKTDEERTAARDKHRATLEDWSVYAITDLRGNTSARAIRSDYVFSAELIEMTVYAKAAIRWTEVVAREGDDAAGKRPRKPVTKKVKEGLKSAAETQVWVEKTQAEFVAEREKSGAPAPDPNPPTVIKAERVEWPGLVTIYHGVNWGADETFVTAIKEADYGASGCAEWQIDQCAKRGLRAFVFLWGHEAGTVPAKYRDDDTVLCYYLGDRIKPSKWGVWAGMEAASYAADPSRPAVFSMSPRAWGGIEVYFPIVRGRAVEYYHYHWDGNRSPQNHFVYLELYRQHSAKNGNVPIVRLTETRPEDMRKTSQTIFTSLAYGVRGFVYGGGLFDGNKRDERGVPTQNDLGKVAAKINKAIKAFAPVFKRAKNVDVFQTAPLPPFTKEAATNYWVRPSGAEVVLGEFADRYDRYFVLANRDAFNAHDATLHFAEEGLKIAKMNKDTGKWEDLGLTEEENGRFSVTIPMEQGGGELLRVVGHCVPPTISGPDQFIRKAQVRLVCSDPSGTIRYTLDGSEPTTKSTVYGKPIELARTAKVRAISVSNSGRLSARVEATFTKIEPQKVDGKLLGPGVVYEYYEGAWPKLPAFDELKPAVRGVTKTVSLDPRRREENYALRFSGHLQITTPGSYTFTLGSDDGSRLLVDGDTVLDIDGIHGVITQNKAVELKAGWHKIGVLFMQGGGGVGLALTYAGPGVDAGPLPLWCEQ